MAQGDRYEYDARQYRENPEAAVAARDTAARSASAAPLPSHSQHPYLQITTTHTALPVAQASEWLAIRVVHNAGQPDEAFICMMNSDGTYDWVSIALAQK